MTAEPIHPDLVRIALDKVEGAEFERFVNAFYPAISGSSFVPLGGVKDGGADAFDGDRVYENTGDATAFYQASVQEDFRGKIRRTVTRLRGFGRSPEVLVYVTSRSVKYIDSEEAALSRELEVTVRIRDAAYIVNHVNDGTQTRAAFEHWLRHLTDYLRRVGASTAIPPSRHVRSPAIYVFLRQEVERRQGSSSLVDAVTDSLILWALEGTDPDRGVFRARREVLTRIVTEVPPARQLVEARLDGRLQALASKRHPAGRQVRWHRKDDLFCLPWETRRVIEEENLADETLRLRVLESLYTRVRESAGADLEEADMRTAAEVTLRALQMAFEREGLEFSYFLTDRGDGQYPTTISDAINAALDDARVFRERRHRVAAAVFAAARAVIYSSIEDERAYLGKLSRTYALLFTLNTEPRLVEYFQDMTSDFYLYVGADVIVRGLSERYVPEPDRMTRNTLLMAASAGTRLVLTEPVLEEVVSHLRATDTEFHGYIEPIEHRIDYEIARNQPKILLRAYLYARLNPDLSRGPADWRTFVNQFVTYEDLHKPAAVEQLRRYLTTTFHMQYESRADLEGLVDRDLAGELADRLVEVKANRRLAEHDALLALAVYGRRQAQREHSNVSEFGYRTWWLTGESAILQHTRDLVRANHGARFMMRPDFLLNFLTFAPRASDVRRAFANLFPSILGVRLARRMDESAYHRLMERVAEAEGLEEGRRLAVVAELSDRLKSDFARQYRIELGRDRLAGAAITRRGSPARG